MGIGTIRLKPLLHLVTRFLGNRSNRRPFLCLDVKLDREFNPFAQPTVLQVVLSYNSGVVFPFSCDRVVVLGSRRYLREVVPCVDGDLNTNPLITVSDTHV